MKLTRNMKRLIAAAILLALGAIAFSAEAYHNRVEAEESTIDAWIMCGPDDFVHCRRTAGKKGEVIGRLETGYRLQLDGKTKKGWAHCTDLGLEMTDGWVYAGYIVFDEPVWYDRDLLISADGRVACRKCIDGDRVGWVVSGSTVHVYWAADGWAVTDKGYIRTKFISSLGGR